MQYKKISHNINLPVIGIGTWAMGGELEPNFDNDENNIQAIKSAIELGMTHIDTAEIYGGGHSEELVGEAIKGFDRSSLFITTKVAKKNCAYEDVLKAMDESLKRLGTNYVNLYLIHAPNDDVPIAETMRTLDYLVEHGKTKLIGVSNFSVEQMKEAQKYSKNKIAANQIEYNLAVRNNERYTPNSESEIIPYCQANDIMIIAYRPLDRRGLLLSENQLLKELAEKYQKTPAQIAINWLISKESVVTIPKSSSTEHMKENLGALGWSMDAEDIAALDKFNNKSR